MFVIHALWRDGLTLWGEDSRAPRTGARAADHPFATSVEDLADVTARGSIGSPLAGAATLALPTRARVPLGSPELVRDELPQDGRGLLTIAPWRVPTITYGPDDALAVLAGLIGRASCRERVSECV